MAFLGKRCWRLGMSDADGVEAESCSVAEALEAWVRPSNLMLVG